MLSDRTFDHGSYIRTAQNDKLATKENTDPNKDSSSALEQMISEI
jgi:hypothetical protein